MQMVIYTVGFLEEIFPIEKLPSIHTANFR